MNITAYGLAQRYVGVREFGEDGDHPLIRWWLSLCSFDPRTVGDEVPWCSAFANGVAWELRLPRSKSAMARSWLGVGTPVALNDARPGWDVAVFWRGSPDAATGHVGWFGGYDPGTRKVHVLGGNQADQVSVADYPAERLLGIRRLYDGD